MKNIKLPNILSNIMFIVLGSIIFRFPDEVVKFLTYIMGSISLFIGLYKCANYYIQDKKLGVVNRNELFFGITAIVLGILFFFLADAIKIILRVVVAIWFVMSGLSKIFITFYTTVRDAKYYSLFILGIVYFALAISTIFVKNQGIALIGLFMLIYGVINLVSYFAYKDNLQVVKVKNKKDEIQEAEIVEETEDKDND